MRSLPPPLPALIRRWTPLSALVLLCALAVTSCGRSLATAPALDGAGPRDAYARTGVNGDYLDEVAVLPAPGTDIHALANDYQATLAAGSNYICVRFLPGSGETPDALAARLMRDPRVVVAERNAIVETAESRQESYASDDGNGSFQTAVEQPAARELGLSDAQRRSDGSGVRVAVLDTGVDPDHPLLRSRIVDGFDYVDYDKDPTDVRNGLDTDGDGRMDEAYGHGTHVAGLVALTAPRAGLLVIRVLNADGRGDIASVTAGIRWAINHGAKVINLSLGMLHPSLCIEHLLEVAESAGVVVVCSAGNSGTDQPVEYPASSRHVIAVAATDAFARPASFSSFGRFVALSAPGVGVRSAYPGDGWRLWSGTSMSAPFVSGAASLLLALHPDWGREEVLRRLGSTARRIAGPPSLVSRRYGRGMLDVAAALSRRGAGTRP